MSHDYSAQIDQFVSRLEAVTERVSAAFGELSGTQLNWKPDAKQWSVGQCLEHLITSNESYYPEIERALAAAPRTLRERLPWLPKIWGRLLLHAVSPQTARKSKTPPIFQPTQSDIAADVVGRFVQQQEQTARALRSTAHLDLDRTIVSSPVTAWITYSLHDTYRVIAAHEERHLQQALRVLGSDAFPR